MFLNWYTDPSQLYNSLKQAGKQHQIVPSQNYLDIIQWLGTQLISIIIQFNMHMSNILCTYLMTLTSYQIVKYLSVKSCTADGQLRTVYMQQTALNTPEYRVSCKTGYELMHRATVFTCNKEHWSPHTPRCAPIVSDTTLSHIPSFHTSSPGINENQSFLLWPKY